MSDDDGPILEFVAKRGRSRGLAGAVARLVVRHAKALTPWYTSGHDGRTEDTEGASEDLVRDAGDA